MMYDEEMRSIVPEELISKEDILFCNVEELCNFHERIFLPELSSFILNVEKVAELFMKQVCFY